MKNTKFIAFIINYGRMARVNDTHLMDMIDCYCRMSVSGNVELFHTFITDYWEFFVIDISGLVDSTTLAGLDYYARNPK